MALLKTFGPALALALCVSAWGSEAGFLSAWDFSGYMQGRALGFFYNAQTPGGELNDQGARAGGEAGNQALIQNLEFKLKSRLPWQGWRLVTSAGADGYKTSFKDIYAAWERPDGWSVKAGRFRVPFGLDPQTSTGDMDLTERPLIYGFGNYGWVNPLGFNFVGDRDYGVRCDWTPAPGFAGFSPLVQGAVVLGNGYDIQSRSPTQVMLRLGCDNRLEFEDLKNRVTFGVSFSYGANHFKRRAETYMPVGVPGDLASRPDLALSTQDLGDKGVVWVEGADITLRMNNAVVKGEAVSRRMDARRAQGYYATGILEFAEFGLPLDLTARWEEAITDYADGTHVPNRWYQALTGGVTWHVARNWKMVAVYTALVLDNQQHVFPGSDLGMLQVQWDF
ncbi:MAG: hypothetical protein HGA76_05495 [Candidatus Firestonebacteria bacterium]|nr:hypothetical protein [Candidatus Firestonebacteria bacterium]